MINVLCIIVNNNIYNPALSFSGGFCPHHCRTRGFKNEINKNEFTVKLQFKNLEDFFEDSIKLLKDCGISYDNGKDQLKVQVENFPIEIYFLRNSDIPQYVEDRVVDVAIVGRKIYSSKSKTTSKLYRS